jgi:hypothetical protein
LRLPSNAVTGELRLFGPDWEVIARQLVTPGWAHLKDAVEREVAAALEDAAPGPWTPLPETEGRAGVRQAGMACHSDVDGATAAVRSLGADIRKGIDRAGVRTVPPLPPFNHAEWCRADRGQKYITPHRDPQMAGGAIAILTIRGRARFRVWDSDGDLSAAERHPDLAHEWDTGDRDLVLLRGGGWPTSRSRCPIHEVESPPSGDRLTLTLRHNKGGFGANYFD